MSTYQTAAVVKKMHSQLGVIVFLFSLKSIRVIISIILSIVPKISVFISRPISPQTKESVTIAATAAVMLFVVVAMVTCV